jgi:hypothetical protein
MALIYSAAYIEETSAHRLVKHGYLADIGREVRMRRSKRAPRRSTTTPSIGSPRTEQLLS